MSVVWLVDAGNTSIKLQRMHSESVYRFESFEQLIAEGLCEEGSVLVLASVRSEQENVEFEQMCTRHALRLTSLDFQSDGMLPTDYHNPRALGIDRLIAATEAHELFGDCLVIDIGTAVTVDFVSDGVHRGGFIVPGINLMCESLRVSTARAGVDETLVKVNEWRIPNHTLAAVQQGAVHAICAQIEYHARHWGSGCATIVLTGGDAKLVAPLLEIDHQLYPSLVLDGIERLAMRVK